MPHLTRLSNFTLQPRTALFTWGDGIDYAGDVNDDRPFVEKGLEIFDVGKAMSRDWQSGQRDMNRIFEGAMVGLSDSYNEIIDDYDWGIEGKAEKRYRGGRTLRKITDSGALRDSQRLIVD